jgi:hypothetical protein
MAKPTITLESFVVAAKEQVSTQLAGKMAILNLKNGTYYSLDEIGAPIWDALREGKRVEDVCQMLTQTYDVTREQCERDLLVLLDQLAEQGLIEVK